MDVESQQTINEAIDRLKASGADLITQAQCAISNAGAELISKADAAIGLRLQTVASLAEGLEHDGLKGILDVIAAAGTALDGWQLDVSCTIKLSKGAPK